MYRKCRNYENLEKRIYQGVGKYGIPQILPKSFDYDCEFVDFNTAKSVKDRVRKGVHFFIDDYRFNRLWTNPTQYVDMLKQFHCVMSPDFSTYSDFPMAVQIYNHYRKHWLAVYLQEEGVQIIPTISWSTPESFEWCFDGEPAQSIVAVSSIGTQQNRQTKELFLVGYKEMIKRLEPQVVIFYGNVPEECRENIVRIRPFQEKFKEAKCSGW